MYARLHERVQVYPLSLLFVDEGAVHTAQPRRTAATRRHGCNKETVSGCSLFVPLSRCCTGWILLESGL